MDLHSSKKRPKVSPRSHGDFYKGRQTLDKNIAALTY